jgi:ketosteroid isomerase-like protein
MQRAAAVLVLAVSVAALSAQTKQAPSRGGADHSSDEAALQKLNAALADALSAGNFKQAGALWDEDGTYYSVEGDKVTGPAQIEAALSDALQGVRLALKVNSVHWASADVAVIQGAWQVTGGDSQGNSGLVMSVVRRAGSDWKFVEVRPWVPGQ